MNRIQPIYPNKEVQETINEQGQQSQIGLNRTSTLTQAVYIKPSGKDDKVTHQAEETVMCRICLQTQHESTERFIIPCECIGSVRYVHESCFTEWIKTMFTGKNNRELRKIVKEGVSCELCKMKFAVKIMTQKTCITWDKLVEKVQFHRCEFITLSVFLLLALVLLAVTSAMLPSDIFDISFSDQPNTPNGKKQTRAGWQKVVLLTSLFALVAMAALVSYLLISQYAFSYRTEFGYKGKEVKTLKGIIVD